MPAVIPVGLRIRERLVARERLEVLSQRVVCHARARGLEALDAPAYEAVGVKAYLIITGTSFEPVSPSSEGSVLATLPFACFAAAYVEASVGCCFAAVRPVDAPEATPMATKLSSTDSIPTTRARMCSGGAEAASFSTLWCSPLLFFPETEYPLAPVPSP